MARASVGELIRHWRSRRRRSQMDLALDVGVSTRHLLCLHPDGLAERTTNFIEWAAYLLQQLRRSITLSGDPTLQAILDEVMTYPNVARIAPLADIAAWDEPPLLVPFRFQTPLGEVSLFTTITTFGTPMDVTIDEIAVELFFPADDASDALLHRATAAALA